LSKPEITVLEELAIFSTAQITLTLVILTYASWRDYKTREVSNRVWAIYAPIALTISLIEIITVDSSKIMFFGLSVGITVGIAFLLFYSGGFGGADSKALMCLSLALPFAPATLSLSLLSNNTSPISQYVFPITVFSNAVLFAAASGVFLIFRNMFWHRINHKKMFAGPLSQEASWKKFLVLITGYKVTVGNLKEKWHVFPMEDVDEHDEKLDRKLVIIPHEEGRTAIVDRLSAAFDSKKIDGYVWATPGLPMLIFITAGLIVALLFGDVVWLLARFLLH
jgi:archaeal preflagellin peptidase FlaK